jgi:cellulose biosynthesis protein BcsQ
VTTIWLRHRNSKPKRRGSEEHQHLQPCPALARRGKRVLAIDNDPQGSLTILFEYDHNKLDKEEKTLYFFLIGERPLAELAIGENPKLIPSSETLAAAESEFATNMLLNGVNAMKRGCRKCRISTTLS